VPVPIRALQMLARGDPPMATELAVEFGYLEEDWQ